MNVLFIAGGNSKNFDIAPFIKAQGDSLVSSEVDIKYFPIKGKGIIGYLSNILKFRRFLKENPADIIHAHYTLSGWIAVLSLTGKPIVLSLMGSDAYGLYVGENKLKFGSQFLILLTYLIQPFVKIIICKSENIRDSVFLKRKSVVIPNGVILENFILKKEYSQKSLNLDQDKQYILFLGNKNDPRKNFQLVEESVNRLNIKNVEILTPYPIPHVDVVYYLNVVNVVVVPSFMEGSPNLVKEAMACNCPVVATNVGDVSWLFGNEPGYFVTSFQVAEVAKKISEALYFSKYHGKTKGRERLIDLGVDSKTIAQRIIKIYQKILSK